ncbi:hypothetical protein ABB37_00033 [Leptomonas pyrrhocoris]|uniref:Nucleoporin n=1 Tax=Leptomonas pyrrhocoris TaxID=157538 RepID=A0A0M9G9J7_LEPPY|nr:hypothetical protein ABB37_00033 [Leptomonas pyrrhocoris]KPA85630.1 hypothetical protein ABB37_00033 [Leptomonas pyrrhocoris]|eukprot:XP_015664069.1 hypothetical protein ABB37_00033 [Leptomonas pyrrhocoris]
MFFAPPSKVPRTQRQTLTSQTPPFTYKRTAELASGLPEASPTSLEEAVLVNAANSLHMPAVSFLSGAGTHMCWMVDENQKLLRLWNVRRPGWERSAPRLAEIPYFAAAEEGLPLFVSEMSAEEESLAFCSERGAISSLDHSIEVQMLDGDATMTASSFVCERRRVETATVIVTVLGTTSGLLVVDLKYDGSHTTMEFDRRDPASFCWAPNSHNNLPTQALRRFYSSLAATDDSLDGDRSSGAAGQDEEEVAEEPTPAELPAWQNSASTSASSSWWSSLKSFVARSDSTSRGGLDGRPARSATQPSRDSATMAPGNELDESSVAQDGVWPLSAVGRTRRGDGAFAFTHLQLRYHYPEQVVAVNAAGEIFLLDFGPVPPTEETTRAARDRSVRIKWATSLAVSLGRTGHVVALTESRHKICVLYYVAGSASRPLPALWLVTVDASLGRVVNFVVLNAIAGAVAAAARVPPHQIKIFIEDTRREVLVSIGAYLLRVNNQVGVHQPCSSEDAIHIKNLNHPVASLLMGGGSLVTLDANGPHVTVKDVYSTRMSYSGAADAFTAGGGRGAFDGDCSGEADLKRLLEAVRSDSKLSLDHAVLCASEALYSQDSQPQQAGESGASNWARRDLNVEDENIVLRVTRQLTARQQAHRRFVTAVLRNEAVRSQLSPETLAQLLSAQEALVCLCALRSLQNVGLQRATTADDFALVQHVLPPFAAMLDAAQGGGASLLQRRPSRHADNGEQQQQPPLVKNAQQLERCQQIMRRAVVSVADAIRREQKQNMEAIGGDDGNKNNAATLTAAELCFSSPANLVRLLKAIGSYMVEVRHTVSLSLEDKFAECYAVGCVHVVVAQTIVESREDVRTIYELPKTVQAQMWTSSTDSITGVELCFSQSCVQLADVLADICIDVSGVPAITRDAAANLVALTLQHKCDMLDVVAYLLYFSLTNSAHRDRAFTASAITNTILREPFVSGPVGYPHGSPVPSSCCVEIGRRILRMSEQMALRFDAMPILMAFALATPVEDPASKPEVYERLQRYCQENDSVFDAALHTLWQQRREWELLSLPTVLPGCPDARARRNEFLEVQAPHLLWLAEPGRYDALNAEGQTCPPYIPYGEDQVSHRSRCNAMARLAWVASGAPTSSRFNDVQLSEAIVAAQQQFLSPDCDHVNLGPQAAVQRLLELKDNVPAWVQAAVIASHTMQPTNEDLLVQVLRHCRAHDGEALRVIYTSSVSERETDTRLRQTAVGEVVVTCAKLQDREVLGRVCETLLSKDEFTLLSSWLDYLWSSSYEMA